MIIIIVRAFTIVVVIECFSGSRNCANCGLMQVFRQQFEEVLLSIF